MSFNLSCMPCTYYQQLKPIALGLRLDTASGTPSRVRSLGLTSGKVVGQWTP